MTKIFAMHLRHEENRWMCGHETAVYSYDEINRGVAKERSTDNLKKVTCLICKNAYHNSIAEPKDVRIPEKFGAFHPIKLGKCIRYRVLNTNQFCVYCCKQIDIDQTCLCIGMAHIHNSCIDNFIKSIKRLRKKSSNILALRELERED